MLARGHRALQIQAEGLRIKGLAEFVVPVRTVTDPAQLRSADVLIVATKAFGTAASLEPLRTAKLGVALSVQNGVMKNELLAAAFGQDRVLGALANISGELLPSGEVLFTRNISLVIGELAPGISPRVQQLTQTIDASGVRSTAVADIQSHEWSKFAAWVGLAALAVTMRQNTGTYLLDAGAALILVRLVREIGRLASASGVQLTDDALFPVASLCHGDEQAAIEIVQRLGDEFRLKAPQHRLSTLQDLEAGRPLEVEETLGFAVRKAAQMSLSLPLLEAFYHLIAAIDRTRGA